MSSIKCATNLSLKGLLVDSSPAYQTLRYYEKLQKQPSSLLVFLPVPSHLLFLKVHPNAKCCPRFNLTSLSNFTVLTLFNLIKMLFSNAPTFLKKQIAPIFLKKQIAHICLI